MTYYRKKYLNNKLKEPSQQWISAGYPIYILRYPRDAPAIFSRISYRAEMPISLGRPKYILGYPMDILFVSYTGYSEDIRRTSLGLIRILIRCIFVWVKVVDEGCNFMLTFSVTCFWSGSHLLLTIETTLKEWRTYKSEKIVLAFVFRDISSIVYNFSFCCELQKCRESPTWFFLLCFSTNRHIWQIVRLSCKFKKLSNFANSDFSVFLRASAHLVTFGTFLWISKICQFGKLEFFYVCQPICTLSNVGGHFASLRNMRQFPSFFFREIFLLWHQWNLCKNNGLD